MVKEDYFQPVNLEIDFPKLEKRILDYWYKKGIVKKYLQKNKDSKKYFSFLDGPITANNPMGVHHAWGRAYKDLWQRFKNMQGFKQRFQNGFDSQGLWVEVEVEKELGLKSKKDIENLVPGKPQKSMAKFVELCKKRVFKFAKIQTEQSKRLGYFMDWENSYYTLSDANNYMIWRFLRKCYERGLIYKGRDSVPWCPRCGTAISQHEMLTEDYQEVVHKAVYIAYPLKDRKDEYLLIWTTTPWTLPANVAAAVNKKLAYVLAKDSLTSRKYYLHQKKAKELGLEIVKEVEGSDLLGLNYLSPFDNLPRVKKALEKYEHRVVESDKRILEISEDEGVGIVHIAPGAGTEDFRLGKKEKLPVIDVIDEEAKYLQDMGEFTGKNAKERPGIIIDYLRKLDNGRFLLKEEDYRHRYPACWRCKTELVWRVVDEWYISMDKLLRKQMKTIVKKINWIPEFGLRRELDWLDNMDDWLISKKRYWGLALPIWECEKCGSFEVVGSREELKKRAVEGWGKFNGYSPHRPWIDKLKIKCSQCGEITKRIPDVGNPWLDAGIVSFSTISKENKGEPFYLMNREQWKKWFPADFITESFPGQFKNWFYSLITMSTVLENKAPFKMVLGFATTLGEDGRPMHKSWGNAIEFNEAADKIGVDIMRWMFARQNPADNLLFSYKNAQEIKRKFYLKLWNVYNFFVTYANLDGWKPTVHRSPSTDYRPQITVLDKWILARLKQLIVKVTKALEEYDTFSAAFLIEKFVEDLSNWFVRRSRERIGLAADNLEDKECFYQTNYNVLLSLAKVLAPIIPFISEEIYKNLTKKESVHLSDWPSSKRISPSEKDLIKKMELLREMVEKAHAVRKEAKIPVRQPLQSIEVSSPVVVLDKELLELAKQELNIHQIHWSKGKKLSVKLDTQITSRLKEEAKVRDLIRKIQKQRKTQGLELSQKVNLQNPWWPKDRILRQRILSKTLARRLNKGSFKVVEVE